MGTLCPGPIMSLKDAADNARVGDRIVIKVTDPGFIADLYAWINITGNQLDSVETQDNVITASITKKETATTDDRSAKVANSLTLVLFSDEMDKGLAAFNIALGSLAMGMQVSIFFTFWGLSLLRKEGAPAKGKSRTDMLFHKILPKNDSDLPISHDNFMRLGAKFMERVMKEKKVNSLDFMLHLAKMKGVELIACQMSMDLMGIGKDELIDSITVGGVATYIERARGSSINLFV